MTKEVWETFKNECIIVVWTLRVGESKMFDANFTSFYSENII